MAQINQQQNPALSTQVNTEAQINGAEAVLRCLLEEGVNTIFGYPGGAIMPVYDRLYYYKDRIQHILPRHEQGAIHAAPGSVWLPQAQGRLI